MLLLGITWVVQLEHTAVITLPFETPSVSVHGAGEPSAATADGETVVTVKDLILILGGLFLLGKATWEIHHTLEGPAGAGRGRDVPAPARLGMAAVLSRVLALDLVFSIDSVLTAAGMINPASYEHAGAAIAFMSSPVVLAIAVMIGFAGPVTAFVRRHPTIKMLALSFSSSSGAPRCRGLRYPRAARLHLLRDWLLALRRAPQPRGHQTAPPSHVRRLGPAAASKQRCGARPVGSG